MSVWGGTFLFFPHDPGDRCWCKKMDVPVGLHLREPLVYKCNGGGGGGVTCGKDATDYLIQTCHLLRVCIHYSYDAVCVNMHVIIVMLHDRMITLISPQFLGASALPLCYPQRAVCFNVCESLFPCRQQHFATSCVLFFFFFSRLPCLPPNLRSLSNSARLNQEKTFTDEHTEPTT